MKLLPWNDVKYGLKLSAANPHIRKFSDRQRRQKGRTRDNQDVAVFLPVIAAMPSRAISYREPGGLFADQQILPLVLVHLSNRIFQRLVFQSLRQFAHRKPSVPASHAVFQRVVDELVLVLKPGRRRSCRRSNNYNLPHCPPDLSWRASAFSSNRKYRTRLFPRSTQYWRRLKDTLRIFRLRR